MSPYADVPIVLSLGSITGMRYRTYNCMECGGPLLERSSDKVFRFSNDMPQEAHVGASGAIDAVCDKCKQKYAVTISEEVQSAYSNLPLYMQPQAIFVTVEPQKKLRDVYCMECGHAFYSISDRIKLLVDNVVPFEYLDPMKLGPMEARCKFHHCKQRWNVMA